jgi:hypothetical protein
VRGVIRLLYKSESPIGQFQETKRGLPYLACIVENRDFGPEMSWFFVSERADSNGPVSLVISFLIFRNRYLVERSIGFVESESFGSIFENKFKNVRLEVNEASGGMLGIFDLIGFWSDETDNNRIKFRLIAREESSSKVDALGSCSWGK